MLSLPYEFERDEQIMIHFDIRRGQVSEMKIEIAFDLVTLDVTTQVQSQLPYVFDYLKKETQKYWEHLQEVGSAGGF